MTLPGAPAASRPKNSEDTNNPWTTRGYLPHFHGQVIQSITYRLADALPKQVVERLAQELNDLDEAQQTAQRRRRIEAYLDAGHGSCVLNNPQCAQAVIENWLHFHGQRYLLHAWVVMPNHVHVLMEPLPGWRLDTILHSWKSYSSTAINRCLPPEKRHTPVWQREYWDRYIRDERHYHQAREYIAMNPVAAGLCCASTDWPWSSVSEPWCQGTPVEAPQ